MHIHCSIPAIGIVGQEGLAERPPVPNSRLLNLSSDLDAWKYFKCIEAGFGSESE